MNGLCLLWCFWSSLAFKLQVHQQVKDFRAAVALMLLFLFSTRQVGLCCLGFTHCLSNSHLRQYICLGTYPKLSHNEIVSFWKSILFPSVEINWFLILKFWSGLSNWALCMGSFLHNSLRNTEKPIQILSEFYHLNQRAWMMTCFDFN